MDEAMNEVLATALAVLDAGWATTDQLRAADAWRRKTHPQLGKLAMTQGKLRVSEVFDVLSHQATDGGLFGQIAIEKGLMDKGDLYELLELQAKLTPTLTDALVMLGIISPDQAAEITGQTAGANQYVEPVAV